MFIAVNAREVELREESLRLVLHVKEKGK